MVDENRSRAIEVLAAECLSKEDFLCLSQTNLLIVLRWQNTATVFGVDIILQSMLDNDQAINAFAASLLHHPHAS